MLSRPVEAGMTFNDMWGEGFIHIRLDLRRWPYKLVELYATTEHRRWFVFRSTAEAAHARAVAGAQMLVDLAQNTEMSHERLLTPWRPHTPEHE